MAAYFVLILGVFALLAAARQYRGLHRTSSFTAVPGRIVERAVVPATTTSAGVSNGPRFEVRVRYVYTVDGQEFSGDRVALTKVSYTRASAERALAALPVTVTVYADPDDPATAVLNRTGRGLAVTTAVFGVIATVVGVLLLVG